MTSVRDKGQGGLVQRHDHPTCPPLIDGERAPHRCKGRWAGTLDVAVDAGKKRKYVYGRTQREASKKLAAALRERDAGTLVIGTTTVQAYMNDWLKRRRKPPKPLKPQTWRGYRSKTNVWIIPYLGRLRLAALRFQHIEAMYDAMRDTGSQEANVRGVHAVLSSALTDAARKGLIAVNPMTRVDPPGTQKNKPPQLTTDQAREVLAFTDLPRWWLALFYGMRQGECLGLRWEDIDFDRHTLTITETLQTDYDGGFIFDDPKTTTSARTLPLVPLMEARLRLAWEVAGRPTEGRVFVREDGGPIKPWDDWQAWRDLLDAACRPPMAPLPYVELHSARGSAASLLEAAGVPDRLVMQILGHSSVQITHGYQTSDLARMGAAFEASGDLLGIGDGREIQAPVLDR